MMSSSNEPLGCDPLVAVHYGVVSAARVCPSWAREFSDCVEAGFRPGQMAEAVRPPRSLSAGMAILMALADMLADR